MLGLIIQALQQGQCTDEKLKQVAMILENTFLTKYGAWPTQTFAWATPPRGTSQVQLVRTPY